jgi:hypothetical protein
MSKGISATNLIVALAVGLIIIVGLGYLVWTWLGKGGGHVSEQYCRGKLFEYCSSQWVKGNIDDANTAGFLTDNPECDIFGISVNGASCREILGLKVTGSSGTVTSTTKLG